jgi:glycosyltransferase involved in cell wall biosynthesis
MNIALVTQSFLPIVGGLEWKVHYLATEYTHYGHSVTVFACHPHGKYRHRSLGIVPSYNIVRCCYNFPACSRLGIDRVLFFRAIIGQHRKSPFDVLHCHPLGDPTRYGMAIKKKTGIPVVTTTCGADVQVVPELNYGYRLKPRYDRMIRESLQVIDVVGSISSSVRKDIESLRPAAEIVDIPNGVDWDAFQVPKSALLHTRLGISPDAIIILSVGRNHIKKGYEYGIKAFARLAERFSNVYYAIVGSGTSSLAALAAALNITDRVKLVGQVPMAEMPHIYHSADIFYNPSLAEGFAQVNAQALASGLPCVLTDAPGNRDAGDYGGALIAQSGDIESMIDKLEVLITNPARRNNLAREAHTASRRYAWKTIAGEYLNIFQRLVHNKKEADHENSTCH